VSTGSKQSLFNACFSLFGPGDEVLIPTPGWTSYYEIVRLARATPVPVFGDPANALRVSVDHLTSAATSRTRGIILNSPCNPTGAVYDAEELTAIVQLAEDRGWWIISDEIYQRLTYGRSAPSLLDVAQWPSQIVVINGVAKAYAMTGWRIGWAIAPRPVAKAMAALQSHTTSNAAAPSQHAALAALTRQAEADAAIGELVAALQSRRDAALAELSAEPRLRVVRPDGAFYLFLNASAIGSEGSRNGEGAGGRFARELLDRAQVAVVPGAAFLTPDWVRVSYSASRETVVEGVRRLVDTFRELAT
jgi:aspartate aminotransferase